MESRRVRIVACEAKPRYHVWLCFDDGLEGEVDLVDLVGKGVFEALESVDFFNQVRVDPRTDALTWGEGIDLDAFSLREDVLKKKK
jgi:hypothetical protein